MTDLIVRADITPPQPIMQIRYRRSDGTVETAPMRRTDEGGYSAAMPAGSWLLAVEMMKPLSVVPAITVEYE